jgi:hypothetical protein
MGTKVAFGRSAIAMVLWVIGARSAISERKLSTGKLSAVPLKAVLRLAAVDRWALQRWSCGPCRRRLCGGRRTECSGELYSLQCAVKWIDVLGLCGNSCPRGIHPQHGVRRGKGRGVIGTGSVLTV